MGLVGGVEGIAETAVTLHERGPRRVSPFFIPGRIINLASGYVSIEHGLKGPNSAVVTACSTGSHAIGDAGRMIALGDADVMVAGGAESPVNRLSIAGFSACRALTTGFNDTPEKASRPYDKDHAGFVMGEGAGVLVLEEYEHAKARGAKIYAEVVGYGLSGDAHHITAPSEDGDGAQRAMKAALKRAQLGTDQIDYVNAHGTSTMADVIELGAVKKTFGQNAYKLSMSSTKSATGHLLGAAGAIDAASVVLQRVRLESQTDTAALAGAQGIDMDTYYARGASATTTLDPALASRRARRHLAAAGLPTDAHVDAVDAAGRALHHGAPSGGAQRAASRDPDDAAASASWPAATHRAAARAAHPATDGGAGAADERRSRPDRGGGGGPSLGGRRRGRRRRPRRRAPSRRGGGGRCPVR